ncbi:MAG: cupin domain-containing protein [Bacteroidetes bacterium HGW-Bacteroidetes-8]|jgi:quercetin dioxygenase-like cupin family protein|nr:MAG: cupin domain-containing protein [Bacteroidetes bacterium HGW-Bacteroidetes-8]
MKTKSEGFVFDSKVQWETVGEGLNRKVLTYDGQIMMVRVHFKKGAVGAQHAHFHSQTSYVVSGSFEVNLDDKKMVLKSGDSFYVEPDQIHGATCLEEGELIDVFSPHRADFLKNS